MNDINSSNLQNEDSKKSLSINESINSYFKNIDLSNIDSNLLFISSVTLVSFIAYIIYYNNKKIKITEGPILSKNDILALNKLINNKKFRKRLASLLKLSKKIIKSKRK